jgi:signal transduction histidine kinase
MGLNIMRERAQQIGAIVEIDSASGKGTRIRVIWEK